MLCDILYEDKIDIKKISIKKAGLHYKYPIFNL